MTALAITGAPWPFVGLRLMVKITGGTLLINECDLELVSRQCWCVNNDGYVVGTMHGKTVFLHRVIMGNPKGKIIDHKNRIRLDCTRGNLRVTDKYGNARNSGFRCHNTSGYRGVYFCRQTGRWRAEIRVKGKGIKLGRFNSKEEAAIVYDVAAIKYHGEFAVLNFSFKAI